jgi:hypothetical protein
MMTPEMIEAARLAVIVKYGETDCDAISLQQLNAFSDAAVTAALALMPEARVEMSAELYNSIGWLKPLPSGLPHLAFSSLPNGLCIRMKEVAETGDYTAPARRMLAAAVVRPAAPADHQWFSKAFIDVGAERRRQIEVENRLPHQDARYSFGELAYAGACYAIAGLEGNPASAVLSPDNMVHAFWPWELASFNPKDRRRNLERAAALLIAEMERLDAACAEGGEPCPACSEPLKADDLCSTDIELGICHAACLEGSPTVDLETGEQVDGPIPTYRYGDVMGDKDPANG